MCTTLWEITRLDSNVPRTHLKIVNILVIIIMMAIIIVIIIMIIMIIMIIIIIIIIILYSDHLGNRGIMVNLRHHYCSGRFSF